MASRSVTFENSRGQALSGKLDLPDHEPRAWATFAHCFTCTKATLAATRISRALAAQGIGVLRFDFAGLGQSEGDFAETSFLTNVEDLVSAANWMNESGRVIDVMIGHSLGGTATLLAAGQIDTVKAVATIGSPSEASNVEKQFADSVAEIETKGEAEVQLAGRPFTVTKAFLEAGRSAKVEAAVAELKRPLLVLHAPTDETVSIDHATKLFIAARHPKSFVSLDTADHLMTRPNDADYAAQVISSWASRFIEADDVTARDSQSDHSVHVSETGLASKFQNDVSIEGRHFYADEPKSVGGSATGPDPYQLVSAGLGACTSMTLRMYADRKKWPLDKVSVTLDHAKKHAEDCIECTPKDRIDVFSRVISIEGDLSDEQRARLLEIADRCPVHRTLEQGALVETHLAIKSSN